ncbi:uncharacterized protein LOC111411212 [Olea europaea subsp. europaea]|uniref:Uncharacterized protein LOC111411212 n=1 Tax=Olea europaea subsp. europaea TaxID=158383 RepID=A0A8S0QDK6_OLEEU|nr:uncharacterized protein LOC111411212 [Olea europaea subsp. europaea]
MPCTTATLVIKFTYHCPLYKPYMKNKRSRKEMDRVNMMRSPEWKQGWTTQTLGSISAPPLPLLVIFTIVMFFLSLSQYKSYKERMYSAAISFDLFLYLVPVFLIFFMRSSLSSSISNFWSSQPRNVRHNWARGMAGFPWGVALLVVVLLVLVSYQSSFHSQWFPLS